MMELSHIRLVDNLDGRSVGILDNDLARVLGRKTKELNQQAKRNGLDRDGARFRFAMTTREFRRHKTLAKEKKTWGGRRYVPYVYTFEGVCLLISRLRLNLSHEVRETLLSIFKQREMLVFDYGFNRPEERFSDKLSKILNGIANIRKHYSVVCEDGIYSLDLYLPDYKIAVEVDEEHHKWKEPYDKCRQSKIEKALECDFVRVSHSDDFDEKINEILKIMTNLKRNKKSK
jgi:very-short-patch-repair endonuclease